MLKEKTVISMTDESKIPPQNKPEPVAGTEESNAHTAKGTARSRSQSAPQSQGNPELIMNIPVEVQVVLGSTTMSVATLMNLGRGAVITLDKQIGDPVEIIVNGRVVARGEVIVLDDDSSRFGVSLTELIGK